MIPFLGRTPAAGGGSLPPPSGEWTARTDVPAAINPSGTLWLVEREWTFDGPANDPPPAPWQNGPGAAEATYPHTVLGGYRRRDQVNLANMAYLDGIGAMVIKLDWNAENSIAVGGWVQTGPDYLVNPVGDDGVYIEADISLPETQPQASWAAFWTYSLADDTPLAPGLASNLREEIDIFEKIGNARPYYEQRFHTNTHGRQVGLFSDLAADEGHPPGEGFAPAAMWAGAAPNDGQPHKWGLMWKPDPNGAQQFFYDGHNYGNRPRGTDTVHFKPHDLRATWETSFASGTPFGAGAVDPATEPGYFPREMKVHNVRVLRRRLPAPQPPGGVNPTEAPVLQAKGLSLLWQDKILQSGGPYDDRQFFQDTTGGRTHEDPASNGYPGEIDRRLSFVTFEDRQCMKVTYHANMHGWLNYRSQYLPQRYRELGLCVDFKYPAGFNLESTVNGNIHGKTLFGLAAGHPDYNKIGTPTSRMYTGEVAWPEDQWGEALGINFKYWTTQRDRVQLLWYPHVVGAYVNGADRFRLDKYSNLYNIPGYGDPGVVSVTTGVWHRLELYGRIDTNRRDGVLELWIDGVLVKQVANLDLGGWVGNRGLAARVCGNGTNGDGSLSAGTGQLVGSAGGGWRFCGIFIREMLGGWTGDPTLIPRYGGVYYAHNWRVYGKV